MPSLELAVERVRETFHQRLEERFGADSPEPLDFHNLEHSQTVERESRSFLELIRSIAPELVSAQDLELVAVEAAGHDLVQNATEINGLRTRHRGVQLDDIPSALRAHDPTITIGNEQASADEVIAELTRYRLPDGGPAVPRDLITSEGVSSDIATTFPEVSPNVLLPDGSRGLKFFQPYLSGGSSLRALALANADLRGALWSGQFADSGNREFRELYRWISRAVRGGETKTLTARRGEIAKTICSWLATQIGFGRWQINLFSENLRKNQRLQEHAQGPAAIEALESHFLPPMAASVREAESRFALIKEMYSLADEPGTWAAQLQTLDDESFQALLREVGYK